MKKTDKNYKYRDILTATDCAIANEIDLRYNDSMNKQKNKTFNVCSADLYGFSILVKC